MNLASAIRLLLLAAIWGGSFLLMRVSAQVLNPVTLIEARIGLAALFLLLVARYLKGNLQPGLHWRHYAILGLLNTALPFFFVAFAAQTLTASMLSILNATSPIWGVVIAAVWHRTAISPKTLAGLITGIAGVSLLVGLDAITFTEGAPLAILAALGAACCYGIASIYAKAATHIKPFDNAHGSMWAATLLVLPLMPFFPTTELPESNIVITVILLGVVCTGIAYLLYFRLIADVGSASALTVTFLVPVFGILWGYLLLDEVINWHTILGTLLVIAGTVMVTGFSLKNLKSAKAAEDV